MADQFYFSRDTKVFLAPKGSTAVGWEIPVLDGFSFSQGTNTSEITLNEMADTSGKSRRSRQMFTDSFAPAEWSFSTYMRPFGANPAGSDTSLWEPSASITGAPQHAVEEALWAYMVGAATFTIGTGSTASAWNDGITNNDTSMTVDWTASEKANLTEFDIYVELGAATSGNDVCYKIANCAVNEVSIDFDIDGIATLNWSGFGKSITESGTDAPSFTAPISEGTTETTNFIRNRLTAMEVTASDTTNYPGASSNGVYNMVLTGGNITISNNLTYLLPETLGVVNLPLENVTGTRSVTGNFTCYLNHETGGSADLFEDIIEATSVITNDFATNMIIGGGTSSSPNTPSVVIKMPNCHFEVPTHSFDDIVAVEVNFHALPANVDPGSTAASYEIEAIEYRGSDLS